MSVMVKCHRCGESFESRGMARHEVWCKKASDEDRLMVKRKREYAEAWKKKRRKIETAQLIEDVHVNGNRAYITISIDLASLRVVLSQLVPYINFHGIEIK